MEREKILHILEAVLFLSGEPIKISDIAGKLEVTNEEILDIAKDMKKTYCNECGINLQIYNDNLQFSASPNYYDIVSSILNPVKEQTLSKAMLEVITIIAYKQPITRLEIEHTRGVNSDYCINVLAENNFIEVVGRKDTVGKPVLFGTTDKFLRHFNIEQLDDLPDYDEVIKRIKIREDRSRDIYDKEVVDVNVTQPKQTKTKQLSIDDTLPEHLRGEEDLIVIE